jgi:hypothetical protein
MKNTMIRLALRVALLTAFALPLTACYSYSYDDGYSAVCYSVGLGNGCR